MGLATGASVAGTNWIIAEPRSARRTRLAQRSLSKVISFASTYSDDICLCGIGGAVQATGGNIQSSVNMLVSVSNTEQLVHTLKQEKGIPFNQVQADGNTLAFQYSGRNYLVENLDPASYADRIAQINSQGLGTEAKSAAYAHDYLTYETSSRKLTDPHRAIQGNKVTLKKVIGDNTPLDFEDVIIGMIECSTLKIAPPTAVATEWTTLLANTTPNNPQNIVSVLLTRLHDITASMQQGKVSELLSSPLVSTSLNSILGVKGKAIVSTFIKLKSGAPRSTDASHLWQAAFLASCPQGSSNRTLQDGFLNMAPLSGRHTASTRWKKARHLCL